MPCLYERIPMPHSDTRGIESREATRITLELAHRWHLPTYIVDFLRVSVAYGISWYLCLGTLWDSFLLGDSLNLDVGFDFWVFLSCLGLEFISSTQWEWAFLGPTRSGGSTFSYTIEIRTPDAAVGCVCADVPFYLFLYFYDGWLYYCIVFDFIRS